MWNEFTLSSHLRQTLSAVLPPRAFLRRDRGEALFISNAPMFSTCPKSIPGFLLDGDEKILRILPDAVWIRELEQLFPQPPDALCKSLERFRGTEIDREGLLLFARALKLLDAGSCASPDEIRTFDRLLRQHAALALRSAVPGGALYAAALLHAACRINR